MATRRKFLTHTCGLGVAAATTSTSLLSLGFARQAAASAQDYRALVCILLSGGNDSFNMIVPRDLEQHAEYAALRTDLALPRDMLLPLSGDFEGRDFGLHPGMPDVHALYEAGEIAVLNNVGTLLEPVDVAGIRAGARIPLGLYSHSDQITQWQTSISDNRNQAGGWAGRIADLDSPSVENGIFMNISLSGANAFQNGQFSAPYSISSFGNGVQGLYSYSRNPDDAVGYWRKTSIDNILAVKHSNVFRREYSNQFKTALRAEELVVHALSNAPDLQTPFVDHYFSLAMRQIARLIAVRETLSANRQTFFVNVGGWDHHDEVLDNQARMLPWINDGLKSFRDALIELGVYNKVTTFTISDFARTLTSNGKGSDHGWGGNHMVMGGAVRGGEMYGEYPVLSADSPLDTGRGVYVPTTAVEEYFAELALWFGVSRSDLARVLPNVGTFYSPSSADAPMGFMA